MINITNNTAKKRILTELILIQQNLERSFSISVGNIIARQFRKAAILLEQARPQDFTYAVDSERNNFIEVMRKHYRKVGNVFYNRLIADVQKSFVLFETKDVIDEFWNQMNTYIGTEALKKVQWMDATTKNSLRLLINKGIEAGKGYNEIAKDIRKEANLQKSWRAKRIARTETHSASMKSLNTAAATTRMIQEKEWISALDSRTRKSPFNHVLANGERILMDALYQRTGEALKYPGDSSRGSAGNIVNCRCGELYHTSYKQEVA